MVREIGRAKINPKSSFKNQGAQNTRGRKLREQIRQLLLWTCSRYCCKQNASETCLFTPPERSTKFATQLGPLQEPTPITGPQSQSCLTITRNISTSHNKQRRQSIGNKEVKKPNRSHHRISYNRDSQRPVYGLYRNICRQLQTPTTLLKYVYTK